MAARPRFRTCVKRGLARRCPHCGNGPIFRSLLKLRRSCPGCGWIVEREPGAVTGAMYMVSIVTMFFALGCWLLMEWLTEWGEGEKIAVALPIITGFSLLALPASKGFWIGVDHWTDHATGKAGEPDYEARAFDR